MLTSKHELGRFFWQAAGRLFFSDVEQVIKNPGKKVKVASLFFVMVFFLNIRNVRRLQLVTAGLS